MSHFNLGKEKKALLANLEQLRSLDVREYTFQKKWDELQNRIETLRMDIHMARETVWSPTDFNNEEETIAEIERLQPTVIIADDETLTTTWAIYRNYVSTGEYNQTPGRFIKFFVVDGNPSARPKGGLQPVLGIGAVSGDLPSIGCRDEFIGWTKEQRDNGKLSHHSAIGSTIVATQPFGFNFLGGKLIAALITSKKLRTAWQLQYGDVLAGMTTTSLFGVPSMYDGLQWWKRVGLTNGSVKIQPKPEIYEKWLHYVKTAKAKEFREATKQVDGKKGPVTNYKDRVLSMIYEEADIPKKDFQHGFERGVYFSVFYENTKDFLCGKITEDDLQLKPLFQEDVPAIVNWWRPKAIERYKKLKAEGRLKPEKHFYNHLGYMDYKTAKETFLDEVGR